MRIILAFVLWVFTLFAANGQCPNRSLAFDGVDDYLQSALSPVTGDANFTVEARFLCTSDSNTYRRLFGFGGTNTRIEVGELSGALRLYRQSSTGGGAIPIPSGPIRNNGWHHLALRREAGTIMVYLDCELIFTTPLTGVLNINNFRVGSAAVSVAGAVRWQGRIDEVRVWNTVRTPAEIASSCNCNLTGNEANLQLLYNFDQAGITPDGNNAGQNIVSNSAPPTNNGTLTNFALSGSTSNWVCGNQNFAPCAGSPCSADFFVGQTECPSEAIFTVANPQNGDSYIWDFGDGLGSSDPVAFHNYVVPGVYNACLTIAQPSGNTCTQCLSVSVQPDITPPFVSCVSFLNVSIGSSGQTTITPSMVSVASFDHCGLCQMEVYPNTLNCPTICPEVQTVVLVATDCSGNTSTCTTQVSITDNEPPQVHCPPNTTISGIPSPTGCVGIVDVYIDGVVDNCTPNPMTLPNVSLSGATSGAATLGTAVPLNEGTTTLTFLAVDDCGNSATCQRYVTVECIADCTCGDFRTMTIGPVGGIAYKVECDTIMYLPCPVAGQTFSLQGAFACAGNCSPTNVAWQLIRQSDNSLVGAGVASGMPPNFSVSLSGSDMAVPGTYQMNLQAVCGGDTCRCGFELVVVGCGNELPTCEASCLVDSLNMSTGFDQNNVTSLNTGNYDNDWILIASPDSGVSVPRAAYVVGVNTSWDTLYMNYPYSNSTPFYNYISAYPHFENNATSGYVFQNCFCVCQDSSTVTINLSVHVDNNVEIDLYTEGGVFVSNLYNVTHSTYHAFIDPAEDTIRIFTLPKGTYCIRASLTNFHSGTPMGLAVGCIITGEGLNRKECCTKFNSIVGEKYNDVNCNGRRNNANIEKGLQNWTIQLCDPISGNLQYATTTDVFGYYQFNNILPGTYTVKEVNQIGWDQSEPTSGMYTVTIEDNETKGPFPFGNCELPVLPCDSIGAAVAKMPDGCCYSLSVDNAKPNHFSYIELAVLDGGDLASGSTPAAGWTLQGFSSGHALFQPAGGVPVPTGSFPVANFCLENLVADNQTIVIRYYDPNFEVTCTDTIRLQCDACVATFVDSTYCDGWNQFGAGICIKAGEGLDPEFTYNSATIVPVGGVMFTTPAPGITNSDGSVVVALPALSPGDTYCSVPVNIVGAVGGQEVCFYVIIHDGDITADEPDLFCCADTTLVCFILPECDPCDPETTFATAVQVEPQGDLCCWQITVNNPDSYFETLAVGILTPGVTYSAVNNTIGSGWSVGALTSTNLVLEPVAPQGSFVQNGYTMPTVCFTPSNSAVELLVTWVASDQTACTDQLSLDCNASGPDCVNLVSDALVCVQPGVFQYTFTVTNNASAPAFVADHVTLHPVSGSVGDFTPQLFSQVIPNGGSATFTTNITGLTAGETLCFRAVLHEANDGDLHINCCPTEETICLTMPPCAPAISCPNNLLQDGGFLLGYQTGTNGFTNTNLPWVEYANSPQFTTTNGCASANAAQMWGNQVVGEGIFQNVNLVPGNLYRFTVCARWHNAQDSARVRIMVDNGNSAYNNCVLSDCNLIGISPILGTAWGTYTFTVPFSAPASYSRIILTPWNDFAINNGNFVSWIQVDDVCVEDIGDVPIGDQNFTVTPYPNPTTGALTLAFNRDVPEAAQVRVLDMFGRLVQTEPVPERQLRHEMHLQNLPPGVYFIEIRDQQRQLWRQRVVKE